MAPESIGLRVTTAAGAGHRVGLEGTTWSVWRDICVRGAGFPADMVLALCDEPLARSADLAAADPAGRPAYDKEFADAAGRLSRGIAAIHADPRFREALTWQNPGLAQFLRDHDAGPDAARRSKQRQRELVIANYLQRYCLKNDTIGFFGPVGWATAGHGHAGPGGDAGGPADRPPDHLLRGVGDRQAGGRARPAGAGARLAAAAGGPGRRSWTGTCCTARIVSRSP